MLKIPHPPHYPEIVLSSIQPIVDEKGAKSWDSRKKSVKKFKALLLNEGLELQKGRCAWCSLRISSAGRRSPHQDHIAPKSVYEKWTFHPLNLVLTCEWCNTKEKKALDTISEPDADYEKSEFFLVHPYLEASVSEHVSFDQGSDFGILIIAKTAKGAWTIEKLRLNTPEMTMLRAQEALMDEKLKQLTSADQALLKKALEGLNGDA